MLYDGNFRLDELEQALKLLDFGVVELIRKNERGELNKGCRLVPIILRSVRELEKYGKGNALNKTIMSLPSGGDCFYCFTNPEDQRVNSGGFLFENGGLYFSRQLVNLGHDRDAYRQHPTSMSGNYATTASFREVIESFQQEGIPLFRTLEQTGFYYDKKSWPNRQIPNIGEIYYEEAFDILGV